MLFGWTTLKKAQNGNEGGNRFNSPKWIIHHRQPIVNPRQTMGKYDTNSPARALRLVLSVHDREYDIFESNTP